MKKQLSCIALAIAFGMSTQLACAQTQSYLTDKELQKLMPDFQHQVEYWNEGSRILEQFKAEGCIGEASK